MKLTRRSTLTLMTAAAIAGPAFAGKPETFAVDKVAIRGYDPVAYFTEGEPVKGDSSHSSDHNGASWQFSSAENKAKFDADPDAFAPQFGGYCAYAVSKGATAPTDPNAWTIVDDKLYLNYSTGVRKIWKKDLAGNISRAIENWPKVLE